MTNDCLTQNDMGGIWNGYFPTCRLEEFSGYVVFGATEPHCHTMKEAKHYTLIHGYPLRIKSSVCVICFKYRIIYLILIIIIIISLVKFDYPIFQIHHTHCTNHSTLHMHGLRNNSKTKLLVILPNINYYYYYYHHVQILLSYTSNTSHTQ